MCIVYTINGLVTRVEMVNHLAVELTFITIENWMG